MVRTGGISYKIDPKAKMGSRISDIVLSKTEKNWMLQNHIKFLVGQLLVQNLRVNLFGKLLKYI